MIKVVKVGVMPGRITEVAVETGMRVEEVIAMADLVSTGYQIKMDGTVVGLEDTIGENTNLILLSRQIKGN